MDDAIDGGGRVRFLNLSRPVMIMEPLVTLIMKRSLLGYT